MRSARTRRASARPAALDCLRILVAAGTLVAVLGPGAAHAAKVRKAPAGPPPPPPVLRFPDNVSESLLGDLMQASRVNVELPTEPDSWQRWGRAAPDDQDLAVRAIADALAKARVPIDLSAMILAIARVESGFNPVLPTPRLHRLRPLPVRRGYLASLPTDPRHVLRPIRQRLGGGAPSEHAGAAPAA